MTIVDVIRLKRIAELVGKNRSAKRALIRTVADAEHGGEFLVLVERSKLNAEGLALLWKRAGENVRKFATLVWHEATRVRERERRVA